MANEYILNKFLTDVTLRTKELEAATAQASKNLLTNKEYHTFAEHFTKISSIATQLLENITIINTQRRKWDSFIETLCKVKTPHDEFKAAQLAQAILESGWGSSELFLEYNNPYGMKYRKEMEEYAVPCNYKNEMYCAFPTMQSAVLGYWKFISRSPYAGYEKADNILKYVTFITYAGYFGGKFDGSEADKARKNEYIKKVMAKVSDATEMLKDLTFSPP